MKKLIKLTGVLGVLAMGLFTLGPAAFADFNSPTNVTATVIGPNQINLSWGPATSSSTITGYNIFRGGTQVATSSGLSYMDTGVLPSTTYSYEISAFDGAGSTSPLSLIITTSTPALATSSTSTPLAPTIPINLTASGTSENMVSLSWNMGDSSLGGFSTTTGYNIIRNGVIVASTSGTSYMDMGLMPLTSYTYNVAAFDNAGITSGWSNTAFAGTLSTPVITPTTTPPTTTPPVIVPPFSGNIGWMVLNAETYNKIFNASTTQPSNSSSSNYTMVNGYPTINGNYYDCNGNLDNDMAHHTTNVSDTDPAHHSGQNCPAGAPKPPMAMDMGMGQGMWQQGILWFGTPGALNQWVVIPLTSQNLQMLITKLNLVNM